MIRFILSASLLILFLCNAATADAIEGYPGKIWGDVRHEMPVSGNISNNTILQGWIEQGIYWLKWQDLMLNTYGTVRYKWDREGYSWNNSVGPGIGIALEKFFTQGMFVRGGTEFMLDQQYQNNRTDKKAIVYISWYGWWDLKK